MTGISAPSDVTVAMQLFVHRFKQGGRAISTDTLAKAPDGVAVRHVDGVLQQAKKALVAHAIQQLIFHLFVREVVQALQDQHANHDFSQISRPTAFAGIAALDKDIHQSATLGKVDMLCNHLYWITIRYELALASRLSGTGRPSARSGV